MALSDHRQGFPEDDVFYFFHGQMERLDLASLGRSLSCFFFLQAAASGRDSFRGTLGAGKCEGSQV